MFSRSTRVYAALMLQSCDSPRLSSSIVINVSHDRMHPRITFSFLHSFQAAMLFTITFWTRLTRRIRSLQTSYRAFFRRSTLHVTVSATPKPMGAAPSFAAVDQENTDSSSPVMRTLFDQKLLRLHRLMYTTGRTSCKF